MQEILYDRAEVSLFHRDTPSSTTAYTRCRDAATQESLWPKNTLATSGSTVQGRYQSPAAAVLRQVAAVIAEAVVLPIKEEVLPIRKDRKY